MWIVDYLSREPTGEPWSETKLDEKFVVTSIECFHRALDCLYSRLNATDSVNQNEKLLEYSQKQKREDKLLKSRHGCHSNKTVKNRTKLDRNGNNSDSNFLPSNNTLNQNIFVNFTRALQSVNLIHKKNENSKAMESEKLKKKMVRIGDCRTHEESHKLTEEEITEKTFHRTCRIRRGTLDRSGSDSFDEDNFAARPVIWDQDAAETKNLISIWDLVSQDKELTGNIKELEAATHMITSSPKASNRSVSPANSIIEMDLTAEDDDNSQEVSEIQSTRRVNKRQAKLEDSLADMSNVGNFSLSKLFDKTLLAELISEDV